MGIFCWRTLLCWVFASIHSAAASSTAPIPFSAHYSADWRSINVGTSDLELKRGAASSGAAGPGVAEGGAGGGGGNDSIDHYVYTWTVTARGLFRLVYSNDVVQTSWLSVIHDHVRPETYRAADGTSTARVDFDWPAARAHGESEKTPIEVKLSDGVQDVMSIQIEVMLDLKNGNLPKTFRILDKDEIKEFLYTQEDPARIRTALGLLDTVVVSSRRAGGNRELRMWFAPALGYVPVLAERSRDGKLEFAMRIKSINLSAAAASAHP